MEARSICWTNHGVSSTREKSRKPSLLDGREWIQRHTPSKLSGKLAALGLMICNTIHLKVGLWEHQVRRERAAIRRTMKTRLHRLPALTWRRTPLCFCARYWLLTSLKLPSFFSFPNLEPGVHTLNDWRTQLNSVKNMVTRRLSRQLKKYMMVSKRDFLKDLSIDLSSTSKLENVLFIALEIIFFSAADLGLTFVFIKGVNFASINYLRALRKWNRAYPSLQAAGSLPYLVQQLYTSFINLFIKSSLKQFRVLTFPFKSILFCL